MYEIRMSNGSYFWTPSQPTHLLSQNPARMVQLGTAANVASQNPEHARKQLENGQVAMTFLNSNRVSSIVDLG